MDTATEAPSAPVAGKPPAKIAITWEGGHAFTGGRDGAPPITIDGDTARGPSPVETLLVALAGCTGYDIVDILAKRRTPLASLRIAADGARFAGVPARITGIVLRYELAGEGIEAEHALRAIDLAVHKYCSVGMSLDPAIGVRTVVSLNGAVVRDETA